MLFSSSLFLFGFLPIFLVAYYLGHSSARNWVALVGSLLLTLDKLCLLRWMERLPTLLRRLHVLFLVLISWVVFRAESLGQAMDMLGRMLLLSAGPNPIESGIVSTVVLSHRFVFVLLVASAICIYPWSVYLRKQEVPRGSLVSAGSDETRGHFHGLPVDGPRHGERHA